MDSNLSASLNNTTKVSAIDLTQWENLIRYLGFYICLSSASIVACALIIGAIVKNDEMRKSRFYVVIRHICVCRSLTSAQYAIAGIYHSLRISALATPLQTRFVCAMFHIWLAGGLFLEMLFLAFLAADRIVSIVWPIKYWTMKSRQASIICVCLYFVAHGIKTVPILAFNNLGEVVVCVNSFSAMPEKLSYFAQLADNVILGIVIALQVVLMLCVHRRSKKVATTEAEKKSVERQLALIPILRRQIVLHCGMQIISKTLLSSNLLTSDPAAAVRLAALGGMTVVIDILVNTFVILLNKEMRQECVMLFRRKNQVMSISNPRVSNL